MMRKALYLKYSSSQDYFYSKDINEILLNQRTGSVQIYNDYLMLDESEEWFKRYYQTEELDQKTNQLTEYYKFHKDIPRIFIYPTSSMLDKYHDKMRSLMYDKITKQLKEEEEKKLNTHQKSYEQQVKSKKHKKSLRQSNKILDSLFYEDEIQNAVNQDAKMLIQGTQFNKKYCKEMQVKQLKSSNIGITNESMTSNTIKDLNMELEGLISNTSQFNLNSYLFPEESEASINSNIFEQGEQTEKEITVIKEDEYSFDKLRFKSVPFMNKLIQDNSFMLKNTIQIENIKTENNYDRNNDNNYLQKELQQELQLFPPTPENFKKVKKLQLKNFTKRQVNKRSANNIKNVRRKINRCHSKKKNLFKRKNSNAQRQKKQSLSRNRKKSSQNVKKTSSPTKLKRNRSNSSKRQAQKSDFFVSKSILNTIKAINERSQKVKQKSHKVIKRFNRGRGKSIANTFAQKNNQKLSNTTKLKTKASNLIQQKLAATNINLTNFQKINSHLHNKILKPKKNQSSKNKGFLTGRPQSSSRRKKRKNRIQQKKTKDKQSLFQRKKSQPNIRHIKNTNFNHKRLISSQNLTQQRIKDRNFLNKFSNQLNYRTYQHKPSYQPTKKSNLRKAKKKPGKIKNKNSKKTSDSIRKNRQLSTDKNGMNIKKHQSLGALNIPLLRKQFEQGQNQKQIKKRSKSKGKIKSSSKLLSSKTQKKRSSGQQIILSQKTERLRKKIKNKKQLKRPKHKSLAMLEFNKIKKMLKPAQFDKNAKKRKKKKIQKNNYPGNAHPDEHEKCLKNKFYTYNHNSVVNIYLNNQKNLKSSREQAKKKPSLCEENKHKITKNMKKSNEILQEIKEINK